MNNWIAVGLSVDLEAGTLTGTRIDGQEIVLWRDGDGIARAWVDRCPHRGLRLSLGFVRNGRLGCLYHGWQFDGAGICRSFPAHPELPVPENIRVAGFPCVEAAGFVWVCTGTPGPAPADAPAVPVRSLHIHAPAASLREALQAAPEGLRIECQPVAPGITALHTITETSSLQHAANAWLEALRGRMEVA